MKKQKASKLLVSILALALVTSIGSTTVFASQSPTSQKTTQNTIWIDPSKGYDKMADHYLLPPLTEKVQSNPVQEQFTASKTQPDLAPPSN